MIESFAPAKINLYLHVTGKTPNGYHTLDSLVTFADVGDVVTIAPAEKLSFSVIGDFAKELSAEKDEDNLVVKAAKMLGEELKKPTKVSIVLEKNLPVASGIGGGSADAAATLRALAKFWGVGQNDPLLMAIAAKLGADVPACVASRTCYFEGTGTETSPGPSFPQTDIVLVNPCLAETPKNKTASVFQKRTGPFSEPCRFDRRPMSPFALVEMLQTRKNDLYEPASQVMPEVKEVMSALSGSKACLLARMSGSGATCFGIYPDRPSSVAAAAEIRATGRGWWAKAARLPYNSPKC